MKFEFEVTSKQDVKLAQAALTAIEAVWQDDPYYPWGDRSFPIQAIEPYAGSAATLAELKPPILPSDKWSPQDKKRVAADNPRLQELITKRGKKKPEEWAEIDRIMTAAMGSAKQPIGEVLAADTAEDLLDSLAELTDPVADSLAEDETDEEPIDTSYLSELSQYALVQRARSLTNNGHVSSDWLIDLAVPHGGLNTIPDDVLRQAIAEAEATLHVTE